MEKEIICIYHKDCIDGTTAAAVVLKKFPHARAFPLAHGYKSADIEAILESVAATAHIYIVDSVLGLEECTAHGNPVTVIDHHISEHGPTLQYVEEHDQVEYIFDNTKSGASLAWSVFFPQEPVPRLIELVEDMDLWLGKYGEETEHVNNYLSLWRNNPQKVSELCDQNIQTLITQGTPLTANVSVEAAKFILLKPLLLSLGNHTVRAYNITNHQSLCGNTLSSATAGVVALYTIDGDEVRLSFRSLDMQTPSALDIAEVLQGGGHRNASGARMKLQDFLSAIIH